MTRRWKNAPPHAKTDCVLTTQQCHAYVAKGTRPCQRRSFRDLFCQTHLRTHLGVDVRRSSIPGAGCGLFALRDFK